MDSQSYSTSSTLVPYLNLQHGIRMDYPNSWMVREQGSPYAYNAWFISPSESLNDQFQGNLGLQVQPLFPGATLEGVFATWQAMMQGMPVQLRDLQSCTLAGNRARRITVEGQLPTSTPLSGRSLVYIVVLGTKAYTFTYIGEESHFDVFLPTVNQMLASLKLH